MERPPLLLLVHRIPYPPNKGDKVRSYRILRHLAKSYRVFLGTFIDHPDDWAHLRTLEGWCEAVCARRIDPRVGRLASMRGLLTGEALSVPYYRDGVLARWVRETVRHQNIQHAVVFSGPMAQYLAGLPLKRRIVDFCDVDSEKWRQYAQTRAWPLSALYAREGKRLLAFEEGAALASHTSLFATRAEAELFRALAPKAAERVDFMENGVDADYFAPESTSASPFPSGGRILVFSGAMDYWPNIDAVCWFARDILPSLRQTVPGVSFWIVGMNPTAEVRALANTKDVVVTGTVPDIRPYLAHADVVVAPLRIARGIQNKVLEAMAMGRPVVAHRACLKGISARVGDEILAAGSPEEFVDAVRIALGPRGAAIGGAARTRILNHHGWAQKFRILDQALSDRQPDSARGV